MDRERKSSADLGGFCQLPMHSTAQASVQAGLSMIPTGSLEQLQKTGEQSGMQEFLGIIFACAIIIDCGYVLLQRDCSKFGG